MSDPAVTVLRPNENMTTVQFLVSPSLVSRLEKRERINVTFKIILSQEVIQVQLMTLHASIFYVVYILLSYLYIHTHTVYIRI